MADEPTVHHIHCDESQTGARFVVYGGIITSGRNAAWFDALMEQWRETNNMRKELKWTRVTRQKYEQYRSLVDLFFAHAELNRLHFKSVVFDMDQVDYKTYHEGDEELGFYRFYYQFLLHKFGKYAKGDSHALHVFIDERSYRRQHPLRTLHDALNAGIRNKYGRTVDVVRQLEPRGSKETNLMQVADVLMGAVGWHANDLGARPEAREAKVNLAAYIAKKAKLASLKHGTPWGQENFEVWRFRFSQPKKAKK